MKKFSIAIVAIAISFMMLAMSAAPVLADFNSNHEIDVSGTATHGNGHNGNGKGGTGVSVLEASFYFFQHSSIPFPVPEEGFDATITLDGEAIPMNIIWYEYDVVNETFGVEFADGQILEGTLTNYMEYSTGPGYYTWMGDVTLVGELEINNQAYEMDLAGTWHHVVWPLDPVGPS